jgi:hypothetical protein
MLMQNIIKKTNNNYKNKRLLSLVVIISISFSVIILFGG